MNMKTKPMKLDASRNVLTDADCVVTSSKPAPHALAHSPLLWISEP